MPDFNRKKPYIPQLPEGSRIEKIDLEYKDELKEARVSLAELKAFGFSMPNPLLLLNPVVLRESLASSEIENIHTTLEDVLQNQIFPERERNDQDKKVLRHRDAMIWGYRKVKEDNLPVSTRLCIGLHNKLMPNYPRQFRDQQNKIKNETTGGVIYTPPIASKVPDLISEWEKFVNKNEDVDPLLKTILSHYYFEAIHPFSDGNGRTGRVLMVLQLIQDDLLIWPVLYISGYISRNKADYLKLLRNITEKDNWEDYVGFMLKGFKKQAEETNEMLFSIMDLFEITKEVVKNEKSSIYSADLVQCLFSNPYITSTKLAEKLDIHRNTAMRYLKELKEIGLLKGEKIGKYRIFMNHKLVNLMQSDD